MRPKRLPKGSSTITTLMPSSTASTSWSLRALRRPHPAQTALAHPAVVGSSPTRRGRLEPQGEPMYRPPDFSAPRLAASPECRFAPAPADTVLPDGFMSTTNHPTYV